MFAGGKLKKAIQYRGLNQKELAKRLGISEAHVSDMIRSRKPPSFELFVKISETLKLDAGYFLDQIELPDDADLNESGNKSTIADLRNDIKEMRAMYKPADEISKEVWFVENKPELKELVKEICYWDASMLRRIKDFASGLNAGRDLGVELAGKADKKRERDAI